MLSSVFYCGLLTSIVGCATILSMLGKNKPFRLNSGTNSDYKLSKAKQYPVQSLYNGTLKKTGQVLMGNCPFHQESTPSFAIYPKTNTWNCFAGCGGGDVISFYMKLHSVDFQTALEALAE